MALEIPHIVRLDNIIIIEHVNPITNSKITMNILDCSKYFISHTYLGNLLLISYLEIKFNDIK